MKGKLGESLPGTKPADPSAPPAKPAETIQKGLDGLLKKKK